jgi:hypothetical protein
MFHVMLSDKRKVAATRGTAERRPRFVNNVWSTGGFMINKLWILMTYYLASSTELFGQDLSVPDNSSGFIGCLVAVFIVWFCLKTLSFIIKMVLSVLVFGALLYFIAY